MRTIVCRTEFGFDYEHLWVFFWTLKLMFVSCGPGLIIFCFWLNYLFKKNTYIPFPKTCFFFIVWICLFQTSSYVVTFCLLPPKGHFLCVVTGILSYCKNRKQWLMDRVMYFLSLPPSVNQSSGVLTSCEVTEVMFKFTVTVHHRRKTNKLSCKVCFR